MAIFNSYVKLPEGTVYSINHQPSVKPALLQVDHHLLVSRGAAKPRDAGPSGRGFCEDFRESTTFTSENIHIYIYTVCVYIYIIIYSIIYTVQHYIQIYTVYIYIYYVYTHIEIHYIWVSYHVFSVQPISGKGFWVLQKMGLICIYIYYISI